MTQIVLGHMEECAQVAQSKGKLGWHSLTEGWVTGGDNTPYRDRRNDLLFIRHTHPVAVWEISHSQSKLDAIRAVTALLCTRPDTKLAGVFNINERDRCNNPACPHGHPDIVTPDVEDFHEQYKADNVTLTEDELGKQVHWAGHPVWGGITTITLYMHARDDAGNLVSQST